MYTKSTKKIIKFSAGAETPHYRQHGFQMEDVVGSKVTSIEHQVYKRSVDEGLNEQDDELDTDMDINEFKSK